MAALSSTLAVQSTFNPIVNIAPGIRDTLEFNMKDRGKTKSGEDERKWEFWRYIEKSSVLYQRSRYLLRGKFHELLDNSYDSIVDRIDDLKIDPEEYIARITITAIYQGEDLLLTVEDNGKPITLGQKGKPTSRYRDSKRHFGGVRHGNIYLTVGLKDADKDITWTALLEGTRTKVKIPLKKIKEFYLKKKEVVIAEDLRTFQRIKTEFKNDAEIIYFNLLKERGKELGLSQVGLQDFIKKHCEKSLFSQDVPLSTLDTYENNIKVSTKTAQKVKDELQWGRTFIDDTKYQAGQKRDKLKKEERTQAEAEMVIAIESGWFPDKDNTMETGLNKLLYKLSNISNQGYLSNVKVIRGKGTRLASEVNKYTSDKGIPNKNIIFLGRNSVFQSSGFDKYREGISPEEWAFFAGLEFPEGLEKLPDDTYVRLMEMLTKAVNLWAGLSVETDMPYLQITQEGKRYFKFTIPKAEQIEPELLKEIYSRQLDFIHSA